MYEPEKALLEWWKIIKPGGYLVLVVPDEDLYEQGFWPSRFNSDHKATFTINNKKSWSPVSFNIEKLVSSLPNSEIISVEIQDRWYDYDLQMKPSTQLVNNYPLWYRGIRRINRKIGIENSFLEKFQNKLFFTHRIPIDQTMRDAVAQIQIVARYSPKNTQPDNT